MVAEVSDVISKMAENGVWIHMFIYIHAQARYCFFDINSLVPAAGTIFPRDYIEYAWHGLYNDPINVYSRGIQI
jgi:hypothetical protein